MNDSQGLPPQQPFWHQQPVSQGEPPQQPFPQQSFWDQPTQEHAAQAQQPTGDELLPPIVSTRQAQRPLWRSPLMSFSLVGLVVLLIGGITGGMLLVNHSQTIPIKHIVFFIKENRTFDNYFGTYPGANGATSAMDSEGQIVPLHH